MSQDAVGKEQGAESTEPTARKPTAAEKFKNVCVGLGALSALILGLFATFKGEPVAEKTWVTLRDQVNKQSALINKLHVRTVFLQAHEEGRTAANLQLRIEALQKQLEQKSVPASTCAPGFSMSTTGSCVPTSKSAPVKQAQAETERDSALAALAAERKRRAELELKKLELAGKLAIIKAKGGSGEPTLQKLPSKLEDVKKGE